MRVLFVSTFGEGHVRPLLPLAAAFIRAGHEVRLAGAGTALDVAARAGVPSFRAGLDPAAVVAARTRRFGTSRFGSGPEGWRDGTLTFTQIVAPPMAAELLGAVEEWRPDLIVHEFCAVAGPLVATIASVPCATHAFGVLRPIEALDFFAEATEPLWRQYGLAAPAWAGGRDVYVDVCPPGLQPAHVGDVARLERIRPASRPGPQDASEIFDGLPDAPTVYVTFGTVFPHVGLFRKVLDGLAEEGANVIVTVGDALDPNEIGPTPKHVRVARFIPQQRILGRSDAVVCHGGSGSMLGALASGVPMVMLPQGADQFWNADACERMGVAVVQRDGVTASAIRESVRALLDDPGYRTRAETFAQEIEAMPSPEDTVSVLQVLASERAAK